MASLFIVATFAASAAEDPFACVVEMAMPSFHGMVMMDIPATVVVAVTIGREGRARSVSYDNANSRFRMELDDYFLEKTIYDENCAGKTIHITIRYVVAGTPVEYPFSEVTLTRNGEIVVKCRPLKPDLDRPRARR